MQDIKKTNQPIAVIILAAGHGTRMRSDLPKVLHPIAGLPLLGHVLKTANALDPQKICVVVGDQSDQVKDYVKSQSENIAIAMQSPPQGTGDAAKKALPALHDFNGLVLIINADTPLLSVDILNAMIVDFDKGNKVVVLGFTPSIEHAYGRLILDQDKKLTAIIEAKDATPEELLINFCNSGVMGVDSEFLKQALPQITNNNAKGEYYLTDLVAMARSESHECSAVEAHESEVMGVDSRTDLAIAEGIYQDQKRQHVMNEGATLSDPSTVYFSHDTVVGKDVIIGQNVVIGPNVIIGDGVHVKPFSHIEGASLASGVNAGPFARLRPGAVLQENVKVGNFVEVKNSILAKEVKVSHLSYIGDADLGEDVNIGAGTITCNYDGFNKFRTTIKKGAFIGSNSSLVAPITIGKNAYVGSGSVITKDVQDESLAVARGRQNVIAGWAKRFRTSKIKK